MPQLLGHRRNASGFMQSQSFRSAEDVRRLDSGFDLSTKDLWKHTQVSS
jgi:hypothetical protein